MMAEQNNLKNCVNHFGVEFINNLVKEPLLTNEGTFGSYYLFKRAITRLDKFSSSLSVNLTSNDDLLKVLDTIPTPDSDIASTINYLVVVRKYLIEARNLDLAYPEDDIINLIHSKISIQNQFDVLLGDYCSNLYYNYSANKVSTTLGGLTGGLTGSLVGFPIGFFAGGAYLFTQPYIILTLGLVLLFKALTTLVQNYF